jgi:hypothetical protein
MIWDNMGINHDKSTLLTPKKDEEMLPSDNLT